MKFEETEQFGIMREQVNRLFKLLRSEGYIARQDFECCSSCAAAALASEPKNAGRSSVTYHRQNTEDFKERGILYLGYGRVFNSNNPAYNKFDEDADLRIGETVRRLAEEVGLKVTWNGDTTEKILVEFNPEYQAQEIVKEAVLVDGNGKVGTIHLEGPRELVAAATHLLCASNHSKAIADPAILARAINAAGKVKAVFKQTATAEVFGR